LSHKWQQGYIGDDEGVGFRMVMIKANVSVNSF